VRGRSYDGSTSGPLWHDTGLIDLDRHRGRRIFVLDDCLDTGQTMHYVCDTLYRHLPGTRVLPVAFVVKTGCQKFHVSLHASGFEIHGNPWIVGYGLDDDGYYRAEPGIWVKQIGGRPRATEDIQVNVGDQSFAAWCQVRQRQPRRRAARQ